MRKFLTQHVHLQYLQLYRNVLKLLFFCDLLIKRFQNQLGIFKQVNQRSCMNHQRLQFFFQLILRKQEHKQSFVGLLKIFHHQELYKHILRFFLVSFSYFLFHSFYLHTAYIVFIYYMTVYNGAKKYVSMMTRYYEKQIEKIMESKGIHIVKKKKKPSTLTKVI